MRKLLGTLLLAVLVAAVGASSALGNHAWENSSGDAYHWPAGNPTVSLGDNVSSSWDAFLANVSSDWTQSVLDTPVVSGSTKARTCKPSERRAIEVCNERYGSNGWLGLAQIWVSGAHIQKAVAKVNDTYFNTATYNNSNAKRHVLCQEVGHALGLDHQTAASCMDDRNGLRDAAYVDPNEHDYAELSNIYGHSDGSGLSSTQGQGNQSGRAKRVNETLYVEDLGNGKKRFTWVFWKDKEARKKAPEEPPL